MDLFNNISFSEDNSTVASKIELSISCTNLPRLDVMSKSDPVVVVFLRDPTNNNRWKEIGRTEMITNDQNPRFTKQIPLQYFFEEEQQIRFQIWDVDELDLHKNIVKKDKVGRMQCTVADIVAAVGGVLTKPIANKHHPTRTNGTISVRAQEVSKNGCVIRMSLSGHHLDKKDFFSKSDPYVKFHRSNPDGSFVPVHQTEVIKDNLNPIWQPFSLTSGRLCNNNPTAPIFIECYDWDRDGGHDLIGHFTTNLAELRVKREFELIEPKIAAKKGSKYKNSGILRFNSFEEIVIPTFLDYITGGTEISLVVGVDYTASNGNPNDPNSLHYRNPTGQPNEYMAAIRTVGDIVAPYDHDGMIPAFGFGASIGGQSATHCFPLNFNDVQPECMGIDGVLNAYFDTFSRVELSGPTYFAKIINRVADFARETTTGQKYYILLMITDGAINDMQATVDAIKNATGLPISVIIVGVGKANFENMNVLDDDDNKLGFKRDIVQFIPFRNYTHLPLAKLAKDTLAEVPKQLVTYMVQNKIQPHKRPSFVQPVDQPATTGQYPPIQPSYQ